jgi:hypothetical protein
MSDPKQHHDEPDELDLDAETVKDLEPTPDETEAVRGGVLIRPVLDPTGTYSARAGC